MNNNAFLRWAGSKKKLLPVLKKYWNDDFDCYYEPFMGSAQLFFSLSDRIDNAIISDRNAELVDTYNQIKKHPYDVYKILKEKVNDKETYYKQRDLNPEKLGANQRAARFIYLNWLCFNGLYRTNNSGKFNVPYSGVSGKKIDNWEIIKNASKNLQKATIINDDFEAVIGKNIKKNQFVYLDPPYALENQRIFTQYCNHNFGYSDLTRLSNILKKIDNKGSYFLMSYAYDPNIIELFKDWNCKKVSVQRNIAGFSKFRKMSEEILITNMDH